MRTFPFSLVIVSALAAVLWVLTAFLTASFIGDSVTLLNITVDAFVVLYRIALAGAAIAGWLGTVVWLVYGSSDEPASSPQQTRRIWAGLWLLELLAASGGVSYLLLTLLTERFSPSNMALLFLMMSSHTWIFFWATSLVCSRTYARPIPRLGGRLYRF